mmetsp:Transcript_39079/g.80023  ORF Transcript_39079/g.80023 Transcript_39079/m.80023 type:complete len:186 (+) Transcript_39079:415-972(+)
MHGPRLSGGDGPTVGSVMSAARGAPTKEEYYLRTLMAIATEAEEANRNGMGSNAQELIVDAIGVLVDKGEMDGASGEAFLANLHRRIDEERSMGNMNDVEIMGFMDTVILTKLMDRMGKDGSLADKEEIPPFLRASMAGMVSFYEAMKAGEGGHAATDKAAEVTRRQKIRDNLYGEETDMPNLNL